MKVAELQVGDTAYTHEVLGLGSNAEVFYFEVKVARVTKTQLTTDLGDVYMRRNGRLKGVSTWSSNQKRTQVYAEVPEGKTALDPQALVMRRAMHSQIREASYILASLKLVKGFAKAHKLALQILKLQNDIKESSK